MDRHCGIPLRASGRCHRSGTLGLPAAIVESAVGAATVTQVIRFADCELDLDRIVLRRGGEEIRVEPQVFDVLAYLVKHRRHGGAKEELLDVIRGDPLRERVRTHDVDQGGLRQAVGDDGSKELIIRTVHGKGYEFVATVEEIEDDPVGPGSTSSRWERRSASCAAVDRT